MTAKKLIAFGIVVFFGTRIAAQTIPDTCPEKPRDHDSAKALAGIWFEKGTRLVDKKLDEAALMAFACSMHILEHPDTVFNAAQTARLCKKSKVAMELFKRYVEIAPYGVMADNAKSNIEELKREVAERNIQKAREKETGSPPPRPVEPSPFPEETPAPMEKTLSSTEEPPPPCDEPPPPCDEPPPPSRQCKRVLDLPLKTTGLVTLNIGATLLLAGTVFQILASNAEQDHSRKQHFQTAAIVGYLLGGVSAGAGLALLIVYHKIKTKPDPEGVEIALVPNPRGLAVVGRF